jgi:hypothetical protein
MTSAQIEQLRFALSQPRYANWPAAPIVPGNWRDLSGDVAVNTVIAVCEWLEDERDIRNLAADWSIDRVRVRPLSCYEDTVLVEMGGHAGFGRPGLINVIVHEDGMALLNGRSAIIHDLNEELSPLLNTPLQRLDYVQLFMNWVHGDEGRFQPVGRETELVSRLVPGSDVSAASSALVPFAEVDPPEDSPAIACFTGTVLYGTSLFRSVMTLSSGGLMEMIDDEPLATDLPVREEYLAGPMIISRI